MICQSLEFDTDYSIGSSHGVAQALQLTKGKVHPAVIQDPPVADLQVFERIDMKKKEFR